MRSDLRCEKGKTSNRLDRWALLALSAPPEAFDGRRRRLQIVNTPPVSILGAFQVGGSARTELVSRMFGQPVERIGLLPGGLHG